MFKNTTLGSIAAFSLLIPVEVAAQEPALNACEALGDTGDLYDLDTIFASSSVYVGRDGLRQVVASCQPNGDFSVVSQDPSASAILTRNDMDLRLVGNFAGAGSYVRVTDIAPDFDLDWTITWATTTGSAIVLMALPPNTAFPAEVITVGNAQQAGLGLANAISATPWRDVNVLHATLLGENESSNVTCPTIVDTFPTAVLCRGNLDRNVMSGMREAAVANVTYFQGPIGSQVTELFPFRGYWAHLGCDATQALNEEPGTTPMSIICHADLGAPTDSLPSIECDNCTIEDFNCNLNCFGLPPDEEFDCKAQCSITYEMCVQTNCQAPPLDPNDPMCTKCYECPDAPGCGQPGGGNTCDADPEPYCDTIAAEVPPGG